jgi:hypothetical protein
LISIQLSHYGVVKYKEEIINQFIQKLRLQDAKKRTYRKKTNGSQLELQIGK